MNEREGSGRSSRGKSAPKTTTFRRLQSRGEQLLQWFPDLGKSFLGEGEPALESLLQQIQSLRGQVSRRAQATGRDLEARAERLLAELEHQAVRGLQPLLTRAHVVSRAALDAVERRLGHLEARLGPLLEERLELGTRIGQLERRLDETRADSSERLREIDLRLAATDDLRSELAALREHLDALSKEQVTRSLDLGKLHDRIVRLEMRFGELLKEHAGELGDRHEAKTRVATLGRDLEALTRTVRGLVEESAANAAAARASAALSTQITARVTALGDERGLDKGAFERLEGRAVEIERTLRQVELRVGDLGERHTATREELAGLAVRTRQLEATASAPATAPPPLPTLERPEGH